MAAIALGLMSGTSCDGVSAALAAFEKKKLRVIAEQTMPYSGRLAGILRRAGSLSAAEISGLNMELGEVFGEAAARLLKSVKISANRVAVIGSHGHTIYHGPQDRVPSTLQIGEAAAIAQRTGIAVISDFRMRDVAAGGEGAPLVPFFDKAFFGGGPARALQNIGGIANVTVVGRGFATQAFDTGPGNCLIDIAAANASHGRLSYDANGRLAWRGRIDADAVKRLWRRPYFRRQPPKSTGRELFNEALLREVFGAKLKRSPLDVLATVTYFTAYSIAESYHRFLPKPAREVIVSGGGVRNGTLMRHLRRLLRPAAVHSIERYRIPPQAKEPVAFAFLALCALRGRVNHLPQTTGAKTACVLGAITPAVIRP